MATEDKSLSETIEIQDGKGKDDKPAQTAEREAGWGDYFRVFTYAKKWDILLMVAAAVAAIGSGVTPPLMNVIFGRLVNGFTSFGTSADSQSQLESTINRQCLFIFILFLARLILDYVCKLTLRLIGIRISAAIRMHYLESLLNQTVHVLDSMEPGAAAGTITSAANTLQIGISEKLGTGVQFGSTFITALVVAFYYSWRISLVTSCAIFFIILVASICLPFIVKGTAKHTKAETTAGSVATEAFSAIRMIYACGAQERMADRYAGFVIEAKDHGLRTSPLLGTQFGLIFFGLYTAFALCFWYGTRAYVDGQIDGGIGTIVVVLLNIFMMAIALERISTPLVAISKAIVAAATFFAVIDAPKPDRGHLKDPNVAADGDITFEGVTFAYPGRPSTKVLDDLHLKVEAGKILAIVGPSGSGKSTIVGLIEKWYSLHDQPVIVKAIAKDKAKKKKSKGDHAALDQSAKKSFWARLKLKLPQKNEDDDGDDDLVNTTDNEKDAGPPVKLTGRIVTSGHNLDEIDVKWWRSQIGLVQQEPFLFNDSIYNNVMHGLVGTQWEHEPLSVKQKLAEEACQEAFAAEFIDKLPDGYETQVGDAGLKLSGGQRQRIAIARSIIKRPKILILDEATSAIDVRSEKIIQAALDRVSQGRTTIMIAHRLSTIAKADRIAVLSKGKLVEQGTHEELLKNEEGIYSGLVRAQHLTLGKEVHGEESEEPEAPAEDEVRSGLGRKQSAAKVSVERLDDTAVDTPWKNKGLVGSFGRLLWEQRSRFPSYVIVLIFAAVIGSGTPITAYLFGQVISVFELPVGGEFLSRAAFWSLMWFVFAVCVGFSYFVNGFIATSLQFFICAVYRQQYFKALIRQPITFFDAEDNSIGTLTARVQGDPKQLEELLGMNMAFLLASVFQLTGGLIIAFYFNWKLALLGTCVAVPIGVTCGYYRFKHERQFEKMSAEVFAESSKWAAEAIGAFRCVSSLTIEDEINKRYQVLLRGHVVAAYKKARWSTIIFSLSDSLSLACNALIFWFGGHQLARGELNVLAFFVCYMAVQQGSDAAGVGFAFGPNAAQANAAANRILSIRESRGEHTPREKGRSSDTEDEKVSGGIPDSEGGVRIELRDVGFKYPTRNISIFRNLNINIEKGQFAALVGASGAGKSSVVGLLERFYDVQSGSILCNGKDIKDVDVYEYRKLLSLVAQEATLFQGTIKENILLGVPDQDSVVTDAQVHQACRDAAIHDFIVSLPEGYNTNVGSRGVALSGGQKQRLSIARAIIRDPKILLLDEATSSLDSESEKQISAALQKVAKGRTTVAVAHRLSTIQHADVIYVLGEGKVLEVGNHAELLRQKGMYFNMCQSQALDR
ncbi:hypothetical protein N0V82_008078 [Gnomoniopsis sp. IMI 355080]|nr:hypothetical protein N0V82_008078 [Gnomoniopsis sp. IMI 355080]